MTPRLISVLSLSAIVACGGGNASGTAKSGGDGVKRNAGDSIGDLAAKQGGIGSVGGFGGGATRGHAHSGSAPSALRFEEIDAENPVSLDGVLGEWPARVSTSSGPSTSMKSALQYDAAKLYVGVELSKAPRGPVALLLAFPGNGGTFTAYEVAMKPGKPGESSGDVRFSSGAKRGAEVPGATIIEAPQGDGLSFEVAIPWNAFHEARTTRVGLRGGLRWNEPGTDLATGAMDVNAPSKMPLLPTEPEIALAEGLLGPRTLPERPTYELYADIAGDPQKERVAVYGRTLTIVGHGYRSGHEFFFRELGAEVMTLELRDVTGDGRADIVLRRRAGDPVSREWVDVWALDKGDEPRPVFTHEVAISKASQKLVNSLKLSAKTIEISAEPSSSWDAADFKEPLSGDSEPLLLPWGAVKSQTFEFDGTRFSKTNEVTQKATGPVPTVTAAKSPEAVAPATPRESSGGNLSSLVLERFKKERSQDGAPIRKDLQVHVAEDPRPERVVFIGKDLVVFGPGFLGGASYTYVSLEQFSDPANIELTTRDLTGDGAAELIVRGNAVLQTTPELTEAGLLVVYNVGAAGIKRIFTVETARMQKGKRVQGLVQFVPNKNGKTFDIDVRAGKAEGWTEKTYPFGQMDPGTGSVEPLLLPWSKLQKLLYAWNGSAFARLP